MSEQSPLATPSDAADAFALRVELQALRERVSDLESELAQARLRFDTFTATLPGISLEAWGKPHEAPMGYVSSSSTAITGYTPDEWQGSDTLWLDLIDPEDRASATGAIDERYAAGDAGGSLECRWITKDGRRIWVHVRFTILRDEGGAPLVWQAFALDVTAQKTAEAERDKARDALIQSQIAHIAELSTPLIPITDDVLAMPLVGRLDRARADRVIEALLRGLTRARARFAIIDVTGVPEVDVESASALVRAARAARLLGSEVVITGVCARVAAALTRMNEPLAGVITRADVQSGVAYAMSRAQRA